MRRHTHEVRLGREVVGTGSEAACAAAAARCAGGEVAFRRKPPRRSSPHSLAPRREKKASK